MEPEYPRASLPNCRLWQRLRHDLVQKVNSVDVTDGEHQRQAQAGMPASKYVDCSGGAEIPNESLVHVVHDVHVPVAVALVVHIAQAKNTRRTYARTAPMKWGGGPPT